MRTGIILTLALTITASMASRATAQAPPGKAYGDPVTKAGQQTPGAVATVFQVSDPMSRNTVSFESSAPLEDIVGVSNQISGQLVFDPEHPERGGSGELSVPVKTLSTGIPLRDEHLVGTDWLDADRYPNITFRIVGVRDVRKTTATADAQTYDVTIVGDLSLHGVTSRLEVPGRVTYLKENDMTRLKLPGDLLAARAKFSVALADFGITGPKGMPLIGSKVGQEIDIQLSVVGNSERASMDEAPRDGKQPRNL